MADIILVSAIVLGALILARTFTVEACVNFNVICFNSGAGFDLFKVRIYEKAYDYSSLF